MSSPPTKRLADAEIAKIQSSCPRGRGQLQRIDAADQSGAVENRRVKK